jgi:archaetidylinositol phosphate synthase
LWLSKVFTKLKEMVQSWLVDEAKLLRDLGLTPNIISLIGVIFAVLSAVSYWQWRSQPIFPLLAPLFLLASGFCDALDGVLARLSSQVTAFGSFLDSLLDRYADAMIFLGIILGGLVSNVYWGFLALIGSLLVSYCRARAEAAGVKMEAVGLLERAERIIILVAASFLALGWEKALEWGIILLAVLTNLTVLQRVVYFKNASQKNA